MKRLLCHLSIGVAICLFGCVPATDVKPNDTANQVKSGTLKTVQGLKFNYKFFPSDQKGPTVIYIAGLGGRVTYKNQGMGGYSLASHLNKLNFNFIGFDRSDAKYGRTQMERYADVCKRAEGRDDSCPTIDGKECAAENIVRNEVTAVIEFIENTATHDPNRGIYLIGGSFGSTISLYTVKSFPNKINAVVFLSPAIFPRLLTPEIQARYPQLNIEKCFNTLFTSYGGRPGLAIGSKKDIVDFKKINSTLDSVQLIRQRIGTNIETIEDTTSLHAWKLVGKNKEVRDKIVQWLKDVSDRY